MSQFIVNAFSSACLMLLVALACHIGYLATKSLNFSLAGLITVGAYVCYCFVNVVHVSLFLAVIVGVVASSVMGLGLDVTVLGQFRRNGITGWLPFVASIGVYVVIQNVVSMCFGDAYKSLNAAPIVVGFQIAGAFVTSTQLLTMGVSLSLVMAVALGMRFTKLGRAFAGISSNPELCRILGINTDRVVLSAVAVASGFGSMAGILAALDTNMFPTMGFRLLLGGIIVMIVAGIGSIRGLVAGAFLLAGSQHLAAYKWGSKWIDAVTALILVGFLLWKPLGVSGRMIKKLEI